MNLQGIKNRVGKILVYTITTIIFLLISSFLILQLPGVQRALARQFLSNFSEIVGFKTTIEGIRFSWFDRLVLEGVRIEDAEQNEMFVIHQLMINYKISALREGKDINLDAVYIDSAQVFFTKIKESDSSKNLNINIFINEINKKYGASAKGGRAPRINIGEAIVTNSSFAYDNTGRDSLASFDYNHFALDLSEAQLQNFFALGDTVQFHVRSLAAVDRKTSFDIKQLSTFFRISQKSLEFQGLQLQAGKSTISDTIILSYDSQVDLNDFVNRVTVNANLKNTIIYPEDLALFAPAVKQFPLPIIINGDFLGRINNFKFSNMELKTGNTLLQGSASMDGLPDFNETFIVLNLKNSTLHFSDLDFLFNENTEKRLVPIGSVSMNGEFLGYPTDFVAKGEFSNPLGRITSDINLKVNEKDFEKSIYRGQISMTDFNLGQYFNDTLTYQKVSLEGKISGSGFTQRTANFELVGKIKSIGINRYNYKNITTDGRFSSQFFNGDISINDPNVQATAKGSIDLRGNVSKIKIQAILDTVNLDKINIAKKKFFIHANVDINMEGLKLDSLSGNAHIIKLNMNYDNQWLALDDITLDASRVSKQRALHLQSDLLDIKAEGDFYFSKLFGDLRVLFREFYLNIKNEKDRTDLYYANKASEPEAYEANFHVTLKEIKPLAAIFKLDLEVGKNTEIEGKFTSGRTTLIHVFTTVDSLKYQNIFLADTEIEVNASKISDSTQALAMAYVSSSKQQFGNIQTKNLITEAIWNKDHIDFDVSLDQQTRDNYLRLYGSVDFKDSTRIQLLPTSKVQLLEKIWSIDPENSISLKGKEWSFLHNRWSNDEQSVTITGQISEDPTKKITLFVQNFNLATINSISQRELSGLVNAEVTMANVYTQATVQNEINIHELKVDNFLIGNITGNNVWSTTEKKFMIEFLIDREGKKIINCTGYYNPSDKKSPLNISAKLDKAHLKIAEPFIDEILSNIDGTISGTYTVTGTLNQPLLNGTGKIEDGQVMVNYLKTIYQLTGAIELKPNAIAFNNIELTDAFRNIGKLSGEITHRNFRQMYINLSASYENFQLLNTSARDNSLFYGQGYASGDVYFSGPINNLKITANASTKKNTRIFIPMAGGTSIQRKEYINFVNFSDSTYKSSLATDVNKKINLTGVSFDLNLDITPDAYCEIIFDIKAGDIIHGRGNGRIKLQLDTKGEFNMFGPIVFNEGGYNFTLYDIINKEFSIEPGSSISWYGDPYQGTMNINATYDQLASFLPILDDPSLSNVSQLRRKYPVQVLLELEGPMLSPQISFDIIAKDLPKSVPTEGAPIMLSDRFIAFKNRLDEQELKRQVFSLIVLRRFSPLESFNTSGSIASSVSELFSNQLSYWMSQVDENLEIDVDLGSMDQDAFNTFQLRLSYTFLNGRLRITRDGTFGNQANSGTGNTTETSRADFSSVAGDWTVDYLLTPDGKFKVKMYSRTNVNPVNATTLNSQNAITTGVSLLYTQSFNEFKDLLKSSRDKNRRKPEDDPELQEDSIQEDEELKK